MDFDFPIKKNVSILALGAESAGNFSIYSLLPNPSPLFKGGIQGGLVYLSPDFGDLLKEKNWQSYQKTVLKYLKDKKIRPEIILTDLHPLFKTSLWGKELAKKYKAKLIPIQHHHAHTFSAIGDRIINSTNYKLPATSYALAMDGTGLGTDEKIWGGEVFEVKSEKLKVKSVRRIGRLENQILIGGDLAIQEPARMLISILSRCHSELASESKKDFVYPFVKKYYTKNEFELLYNQLQQNFNCLETSSAGRVLDAISLLLGFCKNKRDYKHQPIDILEKNSTRPFTDLKPRIIKNKNGKHVLDTNYLFNYVINYLHKKNRERLAATAQLYIAQGLYEIIKKQNHSHPLPLSKGEMSAGQRGFEIFISGGLANNKIISSFLESQSAYGAKKIPRGDAGLSFGQIVYFLLSS